MSKKEILVFCTYISTLCMFCAVIISYGETFNKQSNEYKNLIEMNTEVIEEMGKVTANLTETSDLLMRYNHFIDDHQNIKPLCPECRTIKLDEGVEITHFENILEEVPHNIEQLMKDSKEIKMGLLAIKQSINLQGVVMKRHLEKLKKSR